MSNTERYCKPWNAELASATPAVCRRLGRLLDSLQDEINDNIVQGAIVAELRDFRYSLQRKLEADGWSMSYDGGNRLKVRQPGHKKPFPRRCSEEA